MQNDVFTKKLIKIQDINATSGTKRPTLLTGTLHNFKGPNSDKMVEVVLMVVKTMEILVTTKRNNNNVRLQTYQKKERKKEKSSWKGSQLANG